MSGKRSRDRPELVFAVQLSSFELSAKCLRLGSPALGKSSPFLGSVEEAP
jgi:hypothetical protein